MSDKEKHTIPLRRKRNVPMHRRVTTPFDLATPHVLRFKAGDEQIDVPVRSYMVVGRRDNIEQDQVDVDLAPFNAQALGVSRYHAIIQIDDHRVNIKDFNSSNGTLLNGFGLEPMLTYRLRSGDALMLGQLDLMIEFLNANDL